MKQAIYIVDDNLYMREALAMLIEEEPDLAVCGTAETSARALVAVPEANPDLVLVDLMLPGMNGIELIEKLLALKPLLRCAILSGHAEPVYATQALAAGARGYIEKGEPEHMLTGIRHVLGGAVYAGPPAHKYGVRRVGQDSYASCGAEL